MPWANFLWPTTDVHLWEILNEPIVFKHSSHINGTYVKSMDKIRALAWLIQNHRKEIKFRIEQHKVIFYSTKKIIHEIINAFWEEWVDTQSVNLDYLKKLSKDSNPEMSTRMKHMILSVDGNTDKKDIREFVDQYFLARDAKAMRDYIVEIQPDVDFSFEREKPDGEIEEIDIPIGANFFFPDA